MFEDAVWKVTPKSNTSCALLGHFKMWFLRSSSPITVSLVSAQNRGLTTCKLKKKSFCGRNRPVCSIRRRCCVCCAVSEQHTPPHIGVDWWAPTNLFQPQSAHEQLQRGHTHTHTHTHKAQSTKHKAHSTKQSKAKQSKRKHTHTPITH